MFDDLAFVKLYLQLEAENIRTLCCEDNGHGSAQLRGNRELSGGPREEH